MQEGQCKKRNAKYLKNHLLITLFSLALSFHIHTLVTRHSSLQKCRRTFGAQSTTGTPGLVRVHVEPSNRVWRSLFKSLGNLPCVFIAISCPAHKVLFLFMLLVFHNARANNHVHLPQGLAVLVFENMFLGHGGSDQSRYRGCRDSWGWGWGWGCLKEKTLRSGHARGGRCGGGHT